MIYLTVSLFEVLLSFHILATVIGFGVLFAYPIVSLVATKMDRRVMPWYHQMQEVFGRYLVAPGLVVILITGIYLASHYDLWSEFYVQWGLGAVVVIGGFGGGFLGTREGKLAKLAARDVAGTAPDAEVTWSAEYDAVNKQVQIGGAAVLLIIVLTVFFMAIHLGA